MADVFLSYDHADGDRVRSLKRALEANGWSVSWDQQLEPGRGFREAIEQLIAEALCVVVAWTRHSVTNTWVHAEAQRAFERHILIPVLLDPEVRVPIPFDQIQACPLHDWDGKPSSLNDRFLQAVSRKAGPPALVKLLRQFETRSTEQSVGVDLYDDIRLVIDSFGKDSCTVAEIVREALECSAELLNSDVYNRYDVVPIIVMSDDAFVELNHWYEQIAPPATGGESELTGERWAWADQVLMVTAIIANRLAESLESGAAAGDFLMRVCKAMLAALGIEMRAPPSEDKLFEEAQRSADDVLLLLRKANVQLTASSGTT